MTQANRSAIKHLLQTLLPLKHYPATDQSIRLLLPEPTRAPNRQEPPINSCVASAQASKHALSLSYLIVPRPQVRDVSAFEIRLAEFHRSKTGGWWGGGGRSAAAPPAPGAKNSSPPWGSLPEAGYFLPVGAGTGARRVAARRCSHGKVERCHPTHCQTNESTARWTDVCL